MVAAAMVGAAAVGAAGSAYSSKQSKKAAKTQAESADRASEIQKEMYDQTRTDLDPYRTAGTNALRQLTGFSPETYQGNPFRFNGSSNPAYSSQQFVAADPYQAKAPYEAQQFKFEESPSYQFRKQQGMDGIQSQAAARGGLLSGATLKALNNYNSNLASQEYDNAFNQYQTDENRRFNQYQTDDARLYGQYLNTENQRFNQYLNQEQLNQGQHQQAFNNWQSQDNNAYNRFTTDQNNRYDRLMQLANMGQSAAVQQGNAGLQTGQAVANNTMAGANALAAGQIASANTWNNYANQLGSMASMYMMNKGGGTI